MTVEWMKERALPGTTYVTLESNGRWYVVPSSKEDAFLRWSETEDGKEGMNYPNWITPVRAPRGYHDCLSRRKWH